NRLEEASSCAASPIELSPPGSVASSESISKFSSENQLHFDENSCDIIEEIEYWDEGDSDIDEDFSYNEPATI
ncbi:hypothetical protein GBAR_LOCUS24848, partial [Geodia barretti]